MEYPVDYPDIKPSVQYRPDLKAILFVGFVWLVMMLISINFMIKYGSRIPLAEDWLMVAPLAGKESDLLRWIWTQVNEHRIPFPRLIYLVLLQITNGDFRVGGFFNLGLLGALSVAMVWVVRFLRGGRTHFSDAFFPLAFLHLGHSANFLMGWQVTQVIPTILTSIILLLFVGQKTFSMPSVAVLAGLCMMLLPLCGANGLLYVPFLIVWLSYCSILHWYAAKPNEGKRWIGGLLIGSSAISLCFSVLYFVNYQRAYWNPHSPSLRATLSTTINLLSLGWGPFASRSWMVSGIITLSVLVVSFGIVLLRVIHSKGLERHQALGILFYFSNLILFSLAVGHARAGWVPKLGLPIRYVIFAVPVLCAAFLIGELYGVPKLRAILQRGLLIGMLLLLPFNTIAGFYDFTNWYREEAVAIERDIVSGIPPSVLAPRWRVKHSDFIERSLDKTELLAHLKMLYNAGIEPFNQMQADSENF
jgi:hypothetical protein